MAVSAFLSLYLPDRLPSYLYVWLSVCQSVRSHARSLVCTCVCSYIFGLQSGAPAGITATVVWPAVCVVPSFTGKILRAQLTSTCVKKNKKILPFVSNTDPARIRLSKYFCWSPSPSILMPFRLDLVKNFFGNAFATSSMDK